MRLGLLGHPVDGSRSPAIHAAALRAAGLEGTYEAIDVAPGALEAALARLRAAGYRGLNVTVPHKEAAFAACTSLQPSARLAGAVNTLTFLPDGGLEGGNTDIPGFLGSLRAVAGFEPAGRCALILGAGGAARGVLVGLRQAGCARVVVSNRTEARARALADSLGAEAVPLTPDTLGSLAPDLVVNATSIGHGVRRGTDAWAAAEAFARGLPFARWPAPVAFDLVYNPPEPPFLVRAAAAGCVVACGLDMLARQGALSFERWTGVPSARVLSAMLAVLEPGSPPAL